MLSFIQSVIVISTFYFVMLLVLERVQNRRHTNIDFHEDVRASRAGFLALTAGLIAYTLPHVLSISFSRFRYPNPDTYGVVISIEKEYDWSQAIIDPYYKPFPIYLIISTVAKEIMGVTSHDALLVLQSISMLGILLMSLLLVKLTGRSSSTFFRLLYPLVLANSTYLYGYMEIMIPQVFGLYTLLLLVYISIKVYERVGFRQMLAFTLIAILSLVHFGVIPVFLFLSIVAIVVSSISKQWSFLITSVEHRQRYIRAILLSFLIFNTYVFFGYKASGILQYLEYYYDLLQRIFFQSEGLAQVVVESAPHGYQRSLPYINALGLASFLFLTLTGLYFVLRRRIQVHSIDISMLTLGSLFILLGFTRLYVFTDIPSASIARYTNVYGLLLLGLFNMLILSILLGKYYSKPVRVFVLIVMSLGFIGALLDPFTFQYRPSQEESMNIQVILGLLHEYTTIIFPSAQLWYRLSPLFSLWGALKGINLHYGISSCSEDCIAYNLDAVYNSGYLVLCHGIASRIILGER